eukprot:jgi/Tetstr1/465044/TSEL_009772.t1
MTTSGKLTKPGGGARKEEARDFRPNMTIVRKWARKWGIPPGRIERSERKNKKLKVKLDGGEWVHFGHSRYSDYTIHRDKARQTNYCKRSAGIANGSGKPSGNDPRSPNYYAMRLLWDCAP